MKISKSDFKIHNQRERLHGDNFCGNCDSPVTSSDCDEDGYTDCCNEPVVSKHDFLKSAKYIDINNFLKKISKDYYLVQDMDNHFFYRVHLGDNSFRIDLRSDIEYIISMFNIYAAGI